jgi:acyl-CoA reductase-like NAD-dependent aldehyde dehydrogenase
MRTTSACLFISAGAVGDIRRRPGTSKLFFAGPSGLPPVILFKDAPLEAAVRFVVRRAFVNAGQYCTTLKRAYITDLRAGKAMILR